MEYSYLSSFRERHKQELQSAELDKRLLELSALFELSQLLNASLNLKSILDNILLIPMGRMMISRGVTLLKREDQHFEFANGKGIGKEWLGKQIRIEEPPLEPILISDNERDVPWINVFRDLRIELILPLIFQNEHKGLIGFSKKLNGQPFSENEIDFLFSLSNIAAQAIENAQMFEELNRLNRSLDQKIQELNTLFEIGKELNQIFDEQGILKQLSFSLMGQMLVNQFCIALKRDTGWELVFSKGSLFPKDKCSQVIRYCDRLATLTEPRFTETDSELTFFKDLNIQLIVPMDTKGQVGGIIFLGPRMDRKPYGQHQLEFLSTLANITMIALENSRLIKETIEKERLEEELNIAHSIQDRLLPASFPHVPGFDIHGLNIPSKQVGGDYFDVIPLQDGKILMAIADVSGKGMPAALLMSNLQAGLHTLCEENYNLAEITFRLNNLVYKNTSLERYITFFLFKLDSHSGRFEYVNAGHNPPYLLHASNGALEELFTGGIILGFMKDAQYEIGNGQFEPGDFLLMFTDGVTECMNTDDDEFGEQRLEAMIRREAPKRTCQDFNRYLVQRLKDFAGGRDQSDDITVLAVKRLRESTR